MRQHVHKLSILAATALWLVAALSMPVILLPSAELPSVEAALLAIGCVLLGLGCSLARVEFRSGSQRLSVSPEAGFHVLAAVVLVPPLAALVGALAVVASARRAADALERASVVATGALATGLASVVAHDVAGPGAPAGREVLLAASCAAAVRAVVAMTGQLLHAEHRAVGGARTVLLGIPVLTILVLEAGLPMTTVAMAAPFLEQPLLVLVVVLGGQLLTWRVLKIQHALFDGGRITADLLETFHRYVPEHVAREILDADGPRARTGTGGDLRELSVMFVDIRGFTAWSERTAPSEVLAELNELLGDLADSILATDGTIDKFTGDGLMAFWNAPADQPDHALRAVQALPRLLMRVREFNIRREVQRAEPLEVGIGIATGPAMVGNIGHRDRLAYTAIGDTVNLAARLEKATATHGVPALIDERTFLALPPRLQRQLMRLESIEVKGRSQRVRLYTPVALAHRARQAA